MKRPLALGLLASALLLDAAPVWAAAPDPVWGRRGMIVSSVGLADHAGLEMFARGGNAIDAAVATGFAAGVVNPFSSGIGGGGFVVLHVAATGEQFAIDARETAPAASRPELYLDDTGELDREASRSGGRAVGVPGLVQALLAVHERFGRLPRETVLAPAIHLAREGFPVSPWHHRILARVESRLRRFPETARIQLDRGRVPELGWLLVQEELARTHEAIVREGADALRKGPIAEKIVAAVREAGGVLSLEDLASYRTLWRAPVRGRYRGLDLVSMPPPSSGGVHLVQMLNTLEPFDLAALGHNSSRYIRLVADTMKLAFADRAVHLGDPDFHPVPVAWLTSRAYAHELSARLRPGPFWTRPPWRWGRPTPLRVNGPGTPPPDDSGTTHISVLDEEGNAVALTQSINTVYGSGITVPGTGIVLNNHMDDFSIAPEVANAWGLVGAGANALVPGKRPLSSMSPTIVLRDGTPWLVLGSPGGPTIISGVLQTLLNVVDFGLDAQAAVSAPRVHHQWRPDVLRLEAEHPRDVVERLEKIGFVVQPARWLGAVQLALRDPETGLFWGGADPRRASSASGY